MKKSHKEFIELAAQEGIGLVAVLELMPLAKSLAKYALLQCNQGLTDRQESNVKKLETKIEAICKADKGIKGVEINHDPRGACVKVIVASGRSNSFSGVGICGKLCCLVGLLLLLICLCFVE